MTRILKWLGILLAGLIGLIVIALVAVYFISQGQTNKEYDIQTEAVAIPNDEASIERGRHLSVIIGCTDCHGADLAGDVLIEDPMLGNVYATNLTTGKGGLGENYSDADMVRSLRHGLNQAGQAIVAMPSQEYYHLNDDDLGALIAYLRTLPPVDNPQPANNFGLLGRVLLVTGQLDFFSAGLIDHEAPRPAAVEPGITTEYGAYLAVFCQGCHGEDYAGGPTPGAGPDDPAAANLTPAGDLGSWSEADFITALRTGVTPDGEQLDAEFMPWPSVGQMSDDEMKALWLFLQTVPAVQSSE